MVHGFNFGFVLSLSFDLDVKGKLCLSDNGRSLVAQFMLLRPVLSSASPCAVGQTSRCVLELVAISRIQSLLC